MKRTEMVTTLGTSALIGAFVLTGCGGQQDSGSSGDGGASSSVAAESPAQGSGASDDDAAASGSASSSGAASDSGSPSPSGSAAAASGDGKGDQAASLAAVKTAEGERKGSKAVELDYDANSDSFEVDVVSGNTKQEIVTDGTGRNVTRTKPEHELEAKHRQKYEQATVNLSEAVRTAFAKASETADGVQLDEISLDEDNGTVYWEVELDNQGQDLDYAVDARTGDVRVTG